MIIRHLAASVAALFRKRRLDQELDSEIQAHLELAERDAVAAGLSSREARREARKRFGGIEQMKEAHRDRRSLPIVEIFLRDLRHGFSSLVRDLGFSAVAIGVLALGIGANIAMFSVLDAVLLKPLPFPDPERIVRIWEAPRRGVTNATSPLDFLDWKRLGTSFEAMTADQPISMALTGGSEPVRLDGRAVTADYFKVFTTGTILGRTFVEGEDQEGTSRIVVLSHSAWQTYFGGKPDIVNRSVILDGADYQVIGVLQPGAFDRDRAQFWKLLIFAPEQYLRDWHWLRVHGRLSRDVTLQQAQAQMTAIDRALDDVVPEWKREWTIVVEPLERLLVGDGLRQSIIIAFGSVVVVLLIACANVTNLLLAKGAARKKEMAVRAALGAGRARLAAQLLTESIVLCVLGGTAGVGLAALLIRAATPVLPELIPFTSEVTLDWRALGFAAGAVLGVAMLVGALPSLQLSFGKLAQSMNQWSRGGSSPHARLRRTIVIAEVSLSLVLVSGALLLFRSLMNLQRVETGIRIENVITMSADIPLQTYPTRESAARFYEAVTERLKAVPGIQQAAMSSHLPLQWIGNGEGLEAPKAKDVVNVRFKRVDPGYFDAFDIPVLAGRGITNRDRIGAPRAVVINQTLAARLADLAGVKNPIGLPVRLTCPSYEAKGGEWLDFQIAGVIRNERVASVGQPDPPVVYVSLAQLPQSGVKLIVRTERRPATIMASIREAVRQVDANLPLGDVATMQQVREQTLSGNTRPAWVIGAFAAISALLAALGLYGVLARSVVEQRREIGIRMALGAKATDVLSGVLWNGLRMIAIGVVLGLLGTLALTKVIESLLFKVSRLDPMALGIACASMALIGVLAGWLPASRAARVDPMAVLREE